MILLLRVVLLFSLLQLISCSTKKKSNDCSKLKSGNFFVLLKPDNIRFEIQRTESRQTEYNPVTDSVTGYIVKWTSPCSYELAMVNRWKKPIADSIRKEQVTIFSQPAPLKVNILEVTDKYYTFKSKKDDDDFVYKDTMWIIGLIGGFKSIGDVFPQK